MEREEEGLRSKIQQKEIEFRQYDEQLRMMISQVEPYSQYN